MLDAYAIWLHTRTAVTTAQYPARVDYTIAVTGLDGDKPVADHYRASCDPSDGSVRLFPISNEQLAQPPPVPHGVNFNFVLTLCVAKSGCDTYSVPVGHPAPYQDLLGEPLLSPTYMFGLRYRPPLVAPLTSQDDTTLRTIAVVSSGSPVYRVALLDTPLLDGVPTYHLELTPLRDPKTNRLRELWVGAQDFLPRKATVAGNFTERPLTDVPWTIDFSVVDGAPFVARESAGDTLYLAHHRVVRDATIAFDDIREPSTSLYDRPLLTPETLDTTLVEPR